MKHYFLLFALFCICGLAAAAPSLNAQSPWGVSAHPHKENLPVELPLAAKAGVTWMREDVAFSTVCREAGKMNFDAYDKIVEQARQNGIQILPILEGYDSEVRGRRPELAPLYEHPEAWRAFVRATAEHYHGKLKVWEIWNEEDGGFWKPRPDAAQYVSLLKIAYQEIKAVDPTCQVMVGGLCGWNADFLQEMYRAGAKGYFDILAVHPYGEGLDGSPKQVADMQKFKHVLAQNGQPHMPLWITESGGSTFTSPLVMQQPDFIVKMIRYALKQLHQPTAGQLTIGVALSSRANAVNMPQSWPWLPGVKVLLVHYDQLKTLDPRQCPVLIGSTSESVDAPLLEPLRDYVQRGGLMVTVNSVPFYYVNKQNAAGNWERTDAAGETYPFFRMGYEAWWTKKGLPESTTNIHLASGLENSALPEIHDIYIKRFLTAQNLQSGDHFTPILDVHNKAGETIAHAAALYMFHDWKGGILSCTASLQGGYTEAEQAALIPRIYLTYLAAGIQKIFDYDMHSDGVNPAEKEHNFGMLRHNYEPKPVYFSYSAMTKALGKSPVFVQRIATDNPSVWALVFRRSEDRQLVAALWSLDSEKQFQLKEKAASKTLAVFEGTQVQYVVLQHPVNDYRIELSKDAVAAGL